MFERFTERARRVIVLAQEESRLLNHDYVGTEHLLLGLIHEGEGVAAIALSLLNCDLEAVRSYVKEQSREVPERSPEDKAPSYPFTPRVKTVMEFALREALQLGHNYIGTEHLLLGLIREGDGLGARALEQQGTTLSKARQQIIQLLSGYGSIKQAPPPEINKDLAVRVLVQLVKDLGRSIPASFLLHLDEDEKNLLLMILSRTSKPRSQSTTSSSMTFTGDIGDATANG